MNKNIFEGKWDEVKGIITQNWGKFTENDWTEIKGNSQQFIGKLQKYYGYTKDEASKAVNEFLKNEGLESIKERASNAYEQIMQTGEQFIEGTKKKVEDSYCAAEEQAVKVIKQIKRNPLTALVVAGTIGFLINSLMSNKK